MLTIHDTYPFFIQFNITADLIPPPLADESYYCVFGDLGSSVVEGNLIPGMNFTDLTCSYSFTIDQQFNNGSEGTYKRNIVISDSIMTTNRYRCNSGELQFEI